jgi:hypothetical protein
VDVRRTLGGPAPEETRRAVAASRVSASDDASWIARTRGVFDQASVRLREEAARL